MSQLARITGKALSLEVDGDEWNGEITNYTLESADIDGPTFKQVEDGDARWTLKANVQQDLAAGSAYRYLWDHSGETDVDVVLAPYGNAVPSAAQPHIPLVVTLPRKPTVGGEATYDQKPFGSDVEIVVQSVGAFVTA